MPPLPRALRVPLHVVAVRDGLARHVARALRPASADLPRAIYAYAFKNDERPFANTLLVRRTQLWLFRTHQAAACGDFVVVDLSDADPTRRPVYVLELKQGRPLRVKEDAPTFQVRNARLGLAELAARGVIAEDAPYRVLTGDGQAILAYFAAAG